MDQCQARIGSLSNQDSIGMSQKEEAGYNIFSVFVKSRVRAVASIRLLSTPPTTKITSKIHIFIYSHMNIFNHMLI